MIHNKYFIRLTMAMLMVLMFVASARASSHREAPLISNDPLADNVDLYAFKSPDNPDMITILATYVPFQLPHGGPNYYNFGENIRYEIHVDNDPAVSGDEVTYRFTFNIINEDPSTFFYIRLGKQNQKTTYNLERSTDGGETFELIVENGIVPPNNIGPRSIESGAGLDSDYETLWNNAITTASTGERVFAGPSDDPFFVDLGGIFDLGDAPRQNGTPSDGVACFNVSTIAIQVPISTLLKNGAPTTPTSILDSDYVIGVWASASRQAVTTLSSDANPTYEGDWIQVSRLGMPLTNEAVIPIGQKDFWNSITPYEEINETTMDQYFFNPELALYMDDDQFGGAVPAFAPLRIQTNSLGAFDFSNGADGLFALKGSDAVAGTALDDAVFGTLLLPGAGMPRSVDLWPAFHTGVPNVIPYQLATGKEGNPLAAGKPFVNNFLPNGGDMLRLNMAVPVTQRDDTNFSALGLIQAAAIGLTVAPFNTSAELEFIPNMDGFPNGRRLEDDVTLIELQAVSGAVLAAIGLWYDDYSPDSSTSPVTQDLLNVLTYNTGVNANDLAFRSTFPYVATPHSGTGDCSGSKVQNEVMMTEEVDRFYASSNTTGTIGVYGVQDDGSILMTSIMSEATDADGIYYDKMNDVLYQLNRTENVINAYSNVSSTPTLTATSTSDFINGREIAVKGDKLVVAQDANDANGGNAFYIYTISPTSITLDKKYDTDINLWGIHANGNTLIAIIDNSNTVATFDNFFSQAEGTVVPTNVVSVEGLVRTHGVTFDAMEGTLVLTDIGDAASPTDGAVVIIKNWNDASDDMNIEVAEQIRIEGDATFLGNPVDIAINPTTNDIFVAERANEGGRILGFTMPTASANQAPFYSELFAGASAIYFSQDPPIDCNVNGGMLATSDGMTSLTICADGTPDPFEVLLTANTGESSAWIITDADGNILGLPEGPMFDLDGAGVGSCNLYNISYDGTASLQDVGGNIANITGCFALSNPITVTRVAGDDCVVDAVTYSARLTGTQEVIPALTMASGSVTATLVGNELSISGAFSNLSGDFDASIAGGSHIHDAPIGRGGGIVVSLVAELSSDLRSGMYDAADNTFTLTDEQVESFKNRNFYVNIHTTAYGSGELRGQLLPSSEGVFQTNLTGSNQTPGVVSDATGGLLMEVNGNTITVSGSFAGLSADIATSIAGGAHIHHAPAGRNGEVVRVLELTIDDDNRGAVINASDNTFELTDEELGWLNFNALYVNVHSLDNMSGEIRGQMVPLSVASFRARLVGNQQTPAVNTAADGAIIVNYDEAGAITVSGSFNNLDGALATEIAGGAHLHLNVAGLAGGVIVPIVSTTDDAAQNGIFFPADNGYTLTSEQSSALFDRGIYVNVHSASFQSGEIRGQLLPISQANFATNLAGLNEASGNTSTAMGNVQLEWNAGKLVVTGGFQGLEGEFDVNVAGGSHIHTADAGENGGISLTLVPTLDADNLGGKYEAANNTFDVDASVMSAIANGGTYVNIHTTAYPSGELRGQILGDDNSFPTKSTITSPDNGASVIIDGMASSNFTATWDGVSDPNGDKVVYIWQIFSDAAASNLVFQSSTGTASNFTTTHDVVDQLLADNGIEDGGSITLYHRVISSDGSVNTASDVASVTLTKGEVVLEGCHTPQNVRVNRSGNNRFKVSWSKVDDAIGYEILVGYEGAPRSFATIPVRGRKITISSRAARNIVFQVRSVCAGGVKSDYSAPIVLPTTKSISGGKSDDLSPIEVTETDTFDELTVFPNPTSGELTITYATKDAPVNLRMYDLQGRVIKQASLDSRTVQHRLDISTLSDGIYLMTLSENGFQIMSERIIKTK